MNNKAVVRNVMKRGQIIAALQLIAKELLPNHEVIIKEVGSVDDAKRVATKKPAGRYDVKKREASTGIARKKVFDWSHANIERDIARISRTGGKHTFFTSMLSAEKAQSFHSAICNRAKRIIGVEPDGTKRWRTERDFTNQTITLFVKKAR